MTVRGSVTDAQILAGYDAALAPQNADAGIGPILVGGDWLASSVAAGIADATHDGFGQNDTLIPGGDPALFAQIAKIVIAGTATGSAAPGDFFGITAEIIKRAKINGVALALTTNKDDLALDAVNNDFRLVEV